MEMLVKVPNIIDWRIAPWCYFYQGLKKRQEIHSLCHSMQPFGEGLVNIIDWWTRNTPPVWCYKRNWQEKKIKCMPASIEYMSGKEETSLLIASKSSKVSGYSGKPTFKKTSSFWSFNISVQSLSLKNYIIYVAWWKLLPWQEIKPTA